MKQAHRLFGLIFGSGLLCSSLMRCEAAKLHRGDVTGTYSMEHGSDRIDVLELPRHRVRLYLWATWKDHFGEVLSTFSLKHGTAVYKAPSGGTLTFVFSNNRVKVVQKGRDLDLDFGANASAGGTYERRSRSIPRFHALVGAG